MTDLRFPALEIDQGHGRILYSFAVDGKMVPEFAEISRIRRRDGGEILGYQRPEVLAHIAEIRTYLESEAPMIPNSIVVAFEDSVRFESSETSSNDSARCRTGTLVIPTAGEDSTMRKAGWIVDGQQRLSAVREANIEEFPLSVVCFVAKSANEQREQFILVNSTKPLPKGLIYELLPGTEGRLPSLLERRRFPAQLMHRLNFDEESPMRGRIRTPTNPDGVIKDNSVLRMIENSLTDGALYRFRSADRHGGDVESMMAVLSRFWAAVASVFPAAWDLPPRRSRLVHGAGVASLGFIMDAISDRYRAQGIPTVEQYREELVPLEEVCRWTDGYWEFGPGAQRRWNEVQNTSKDIQILSNFLLVRYKSRAWDRLSKP